MLRTALAVAATALIAACGTSFPTAPDATPSPIGTGPTGVPGPTATALPTVPPLPAGPTAEIDVLVTDGEFDGSYRAVAANACDSNPAQNTFTVAYANDFAADRFVALRLELRNAMLAQEDASSDFLLELSLNGAGGGVSYALDPANDDSVGDAYLDLTDGEATLDLSVTAPDDTILDLTVICEL